MPITSAFTIGEYVDMDKGVQLAEGGIVFWAEGNEAKILALKRIEPVSWLSSDADAALASIALGLDKDNGEKILKRCVSVVFPIKFLSYNIVRMVGIFQQLTRWMKCLKLIMVE